MQCQCIRQAQHLRNDVIKLGLPRGRAFPALMPHAELPVSSSHVSRRVAPPADVEAGEAPLKKKNAGAGQILAVWRSLWDRGSRHQVRSAVGFADIRGHVNVLHLSAPGAPVQSSRSSSCKLRFRFPFRVRDSWTDPEQMHMSPTWAPPVPECAFWPITTACSG